MNATKYYRHCTRNTTFWTQVQAEQVQYKVLNIKTTKGGRCSKLENTKQANTSEWGQYKSKTEETWGRSTNWKARKTRMEGRMDWNFSVEGAKTCKDKWFETCSECGLSEHLECSALVCRFPQQYHCESSVEKKRGVFLGRRWWPYAAYPPFRSLGLKGQLGGAVRDINFFTTKKQTNKQVFLFNITFRNFFWMINNCSQWKINVASPSLYYRISVYSPHSKNVVIERNGFQHAWFEAFDLEHNKWWWQYPLKGSWPTTTKKIQAICATARWTSVMSTHPLVG